MLYFFWIVYLSLGVGIFLVQKRLIFFPPPRNTLLYYHWKHSEFFIHNNNVKLQAWRITNVTSKKDDSILYFGGNAEDAVYSLEMGQDYAVKNVFFINLRGYGESSGSPSQQGFYSDCLAVYDYITSHFEINPDNLILMGRSLGAAVAIYANSQRKAKALVAITPFDRIYCLVPKLLRYFFPIKLLLRNTFDNIKFIRQVNNPILIIAASDDEVIPLARTKHLIERSNQKIRLEIIPQANHQSILEKTATYSIINNFIGMGE
ncbi:MAG: hypothetical protein HY080_03510 [Gammaproteobacteria bacterium]|nr:hypothetical protein [Gammaproteobacteria bacterium]